MSRKRSKDPTVGIRITVPRSVLDDLHQELSIGESRSAWIARVMKNQLEASGTIVADASSIQLLTVLFNRGCMNLELYEALKYQITSSNPSEEV